MTQYVLIKGLNMVNQINKELVQEAKLINGKYIDYPREFNSKDEMREFYNEYGYITLKGCIPKDYIDNIVDTLTSAFQPYSSDSNNPVDSGIINLDRENKELLHNIHAATSKSCAFMKVAGKLEETIKDIAEENLPCFGINVGYLLGISKDDRLVYNFHQEANYMKGFSDIVNVHYPLLRTSNLDNGTMSIIPRSHKYGTLDYDKKRKTNNSYTDLIPSNIDQIVKDGHELHCYLEVGDAVFFHKNLIHKSNFNSTNFCRPAGIIRLTQSIAGDWAQRKPEEL